MLESDRDGHVVTLRFADPQRRNALGYAQVAELVAALREAADDDQVRAVVLTGSGTAFSAGGDLNEFRRELKGSALELYDSGAVWAELFTLVPRLRLPLIAAVNGPALGGGCGIVALCDLAIASREATFALSEIRIGLFPIVVLPALRRVVGERVARQMALTGDQLDAAEAQRVGLVNRVVEPAALQAEAADLAARLARLGPTALGLGKRLLADTAGLDYDEAVGHAQAMRGVFLTNPELVEGVAAFLDKRPPQW
ncbi:MAG: enoyl-CoA hydratase/isomerase family protein [Euzebyales bacterium]|nr:enoyl-CoA hydratase/isomerase family protein [Euzebyales bacterium]MBA3621683.1 enoyl-CoA hydratase/isomerase family protein [Euzebyales bacterium]